MDYVPLINNRLVCECVINSGNVYKRADVLIDTGAGRTVLTRLEACGLKLTNCLGYIKCESLSGGIIPIYLYRIDSLIVCNCGLRNCIIGVAASDDYTQGVLGMDILSKIDFSYNAEEECLRLRLPAHKYSNTEYVPKSDMRRVVSRVLKFLDKRDKLDYVMSCLPEAGDIPYSQLRDLVIGLVSSH